MRQYFHAPKEPSEGATEKGLMLHEAIATQYQIMSSLKLDVISLESKTFEWW